MTQRKHTPSYTAEFRARGVRLFNEPCLSGCHSKDEPYDTTQTYPVLYG